MNEEKEKINVRNINEMTSIGKKILKITYVLLITLAIYVFTLVNKEWGVLKFVWTIFEVISPLFLGILIAYLFNPLITRMTKKGKMNRAVATSIVYLVLAAGLTAIFSLFPWFDAGEVQEVGFSYYLTGGDRLVAFLTLVVVAPIAEEIIFRGWLYGRTREKLLKKYSNNISVVISIILISLLFGIVHMQWNVGISVFALSLVLCALREITGTIHAGILLHMLKNGIAFYLLFVIGMG